MKNNYSIDERQILIRGNIYKHMFILMGVLFLLDALVKDFNFIWVEGIYSSILIVIFSIMVGSIEMILKNVYFTEGSRQKYFVLLLGGISIVSCILTIIEMINQKGNIILNGKLSKDGAFLSISGSILIIAVIFVIQQFRNSKLEEQQDNE